MEALELKEAQLYRMLCEIFGRDLVVPHMSLLAVCGGELPPNQLKISNLKAWAKANKCLFTVVDSDDQPKLVVEFFEGFADYINPTEEEHQRIMKPILENRNIAYITISSAEFSEILNCPEENGFCEFMHAKVEGRIYSAQDRHED